MATAFINKGYLTNIANAIREKLGETSEYALSEFSSKIDSIPTGSELSCLIFVALEESTISLTGYGIAPVLEYNLNLTGWSDWTYTTSETDSEGGVENTYTTISMSEGDFVCVRGDNDAISTGYGTFSQFVMSGRVCAIGNVMSLLSKDCGKNTIGPYGFYNLFSDCVSLVTAPELPATTLGESCYDSMFSGCTSLTTAPRLSSEILGDYCYYGMFYGCTSLTTAPELPATTLTIGCYSYMFYNCTSLTIAPELPATTLTIECYYNMFRDCTSLTTAPELPAISMEDSCYTSMFQGCTSLTTAPELPATTLNHMCYANMFEGCVLLTTAPELPAKTLIIHCYAGMFRNCSKLSYIKVGATYWYSSNGWICSQDWVDGVASTGTFVKPSKLSISSGVSGIPSGWTVKNV